MLIVPVRVDAGPAATEYVTVPFPVPLVPDVIRMKLSLALAVHVHPEGVITPTEPDPPAALKFLDSSVEDSENVHAELGLATKACSEPLKPW